jgi:EmrB/QacA subfamily drug resistance transporter
MQADVNGRNGAGGDAGRDALPKEVWVIAGVVILGVVMSILDTTIVNVALETLSRDLHSPLSTIQWVSTGYLLALATVIPLTGWMSERYGSKRIWMISVTLFGVGSALCGAAWSAESLIFFRVLQGFGGGMIMPVGMSVLTQTAGPKRVGRVMSVIGVPMLLGPVLGPVLGGLIVDNASWRWIFYVNIPIVLLALVLGKRLLPDDTGRADDRGGALDWRGVLLLSPGLGAIVFGLSELETQGGIGHAEVWAPILAGVLLVAGFVVHALHRTRPLLDVRLFKNPSFSAAAFTTFLVGGGLFGAMLVLPLYYQVARGQSPLDAGLLMAPQGIGAALVMPIAGRLTDRVGGGRVALVGIVLATLGTLPFMFVGPDTPYGLLAGTLVVRGFGLAGTMMPAMAAAYAVLDRSAVPRATSALNVIQRVGGSMGTAVLAVVLEHEIATSLPGGGGGGGGGIQRLPETVRERVADPLANAFGQTFAWAVGVTVLAIIPAAILVITTRRTERRERAEEAARATEAGPAEATPDEIAV